MSKIKIALLVFCFPIALHAQRFNWQAKVENVTSEGFVKILLSAEVSSQLRDGFPDIRIYDKDNFETPYLVYRDDAKQGLDRFITYQVVETHYTRGCCSFITVKNSTDKPIDHIVLEVNNADASRQMNLAGSYDGSNWFTVRDQFIVETFNGIYKGEKKTTNLIRFNFPLTDYKFYKFEFDDWHYWWRDYKNPIFIVRAGYVEPTFIPERCITLPNPTFMQQDTLRESQIRFDFEEDQYIDHLKFDLSQVKNKDYYRAASLFELVKNKNGNGWDERYIGSTVLSSLNDNEMSFNESKMGHFVLKISNQDDRPLICNGIKAMQVKNYLVAELEANNSYSIRFGNDSIQAPIYDLQYFKAKIPDSLKQLTVLARTNIAKLNQIVHLAESKKAKETEKATFFTSKKFIWIGVSIVGILLLFLTSRMLRDMKKE